MPGNRLVIVSDAHLYHPNRYRTDALFLTFLKHVPEIGDHLVINGDLFEFWFEYRSVIPRQLFPTLARLAELREHGVQLTVTGGNHDRWGGPFWREQLGARFEPEQCDIQFVNGCVRCIHGDGLGERHTGARILHWITRRRFTTSMFRLIHPDLGIWGVKKLSRVLGHGSPSRHAINHASETQTSFARNYLTKRPNIQMLVMGHTHKAALVKVSPEQWYLNPGPWAVEARYATVTEAGPELHVFDG